MNIYLYYIHIYTYTHFLCMYICQNKEKATFSIDNSIDLLYINQCSQQILIVHLVHAHPVCTSIIS